MDATCACETRAQEGGVEQSDEEDRDGGCVEVSDSGSSVHVERLDMGTHDVR